MIYFERKFRVQRSQKFIKLSFAYLRKINLIFIFLLAYILRLELGLGKLWYRTGGPGGLPPWLGFGLGKLMNRLGGTGGLPSGLGFGLGMLSNRFFV